MIQASLLDAECLFCMPYLFSVVPVGRRESGQARVEGCGRLNVCPASLPDTTGSSTKEVAKMKIYLLRGGEKQAMVIRVNGGR